jgi:hypothetical protein
LIFRQVGEASKGLEVGMMALTGVMMGSVTFGIYAVVGAVKALIDHFAKQKEIALAASAATVQFWTDALQGHAEARKAAEDYAGAMKKILDNVDALKTKEVEEETILKHILDARLKILEAQRQADVAAAKGDKEEEARINARYGQRKSNIELENEQTEINLKKRQLDDQSADARRKELVTQAAEKAKEAGAPGRDEALSAERRQDDLTKELATLQAARMKPADLEHWRSEAARLEGLRQSGSLLWDPLVASGYGSEVMKQAKKGNQAEQAFFAASQEYEQNAADIDRYKKGTKALADAVEEAVKEFNKSLEAARATRAEIGKDEAVHGVNVDAANTIKRIKEGEIIQAGGAPDNPLSRSVVSDIQAMEALGAGQRMDAKQTEMINHLVAGLRAQGASQATINGLLLEMKDLHVTAAQKFTDIWRELGQVRKQMKNQAAPP